MTDRPRALAPQDILAIWQEVYGELDQRWTKAFLQHRAISRLAQYPRWRLEEVLRETSKLDIALGKLRYADQVFHGLNDDEDLDGYKCQMCGYRVQGNACKCRDE